MGLPYTPEGLERFCEGLLTIDDQGGTGRIPFRLNAEQRAAAQILAEERLSYLLKPRQIGMSTFVLASDVAWAMARDIAGEPAECAIVWDTLPKAKSKIRLARRWLNDLGAPVKGDTTRIELPNGTLITGHTAGGQNPARGDAVKRIHISEWPYWPDPKTNFQGMQASLGTADDVSVIIETTFKKAHPFPETFWDERNDFAKVFFPMSMHAEYQRPDLVDKLKDHEVVWLKDNGFTDETMAHGAFFIWALANKYGGDKVALFRDFPQRPEHCFSVDEGRWVSVDPEVIPPQLVLVCDGVTSQWHVEIFKLPKQVQGRCVISVDTSEGVGQDRSAVVVLDTHDWKICATFASEWAAYDDLAAVVAKIYDYYLIDPGDGLRNHRNSRPELIVERNGPGLPTVKTLRNGGYPVTLHKQTQSTKYRGLVHAKREIESGRAYGPLCLRQDARACHKDGGRWKGWKDVLAALGFAHCWAEADKAPTVEPKQRSAAWELYQQRLNLGGEPTLF